MIKKVAVVLSTGGARGIAHIGVLEEIEKCGYEISSITGCSMGALVGAAYATGNLHKFKKAICDITRLDMLRLMDFAFSSKGLIKGNKIMELVSQIIPEINIEDLPIPFTAVATNVLNDQEIVFNKGSLHDAIRASISLPFIFTPKKLNDMELIDGGIINPLPLSHTKRRKEELVIAVISCNTKENSKVFNYSAINLITESITMIIQKLIQASIDKYSPDIIIRIPVRNFGILQFNKARLIIEAGVDETRKCLHY